MSDAQSLFRSVDASTLSVKEAYQFMISAVVPRPIAFVTTRGRDGSINAAPFSYFNAVSSRPLCVSFSVTARRDGKLKDTLRNLRETGEMVIHIASDALAEAVNGAGAEFEYGVNELTQVGLTQVKSVQVSPPRIAECPIQLEARVFQEVPIGDGGPGSSVLVIAEVLQIHVSNHVLLDKSLTVNPLNLKPLLRLGGPQYARLGEVFSLEKQSKKV